MSFATSETALVNLIIANISGYTANNTKAGEEDAAFSYAAINGGNLCVTDYAGGNIDSQPSRITIDELWMWDCVVTFFIHYDHDTIETSIRTLSNDFMTMHKNNKRLSDGAVWFVQAARAYQILKRNDRPYVPVSFLCQFKAPI